MERKELSTEGLPDSWIAKMREAVLLADFDLVEKLVNEIASQDALRAQKLINLAEQFDAKALLRFLNRPNKPTRKNS